MVLLLVTALFFGLSLVMILIGHQQPPSTWAQLFHLSECELPCWIGIVPGQTTLAEAQRQVQKIYGDKSLYAETHEKYTQTEIFYSTSGKGIGILFYTSDPNNERPDATIHEIDLIPYVQQDSPNEFTTISDLYGELGNPEVARLGNGAYNFRVALLYKNRSVIEFVPEYPCECVVPSHGINYIAIVVDSESSNQSWLSESTQWLGFRRHHNFVMKSDSTMK